MIFHHLEAIFVHIPKTAGTSLIRLLSGGHVWPLDANYEVLTGWCPERRIWLQHATPTELVDTGLVTKSEWDQYRKFTVVRNPFDRAVSDFYWMRTQVGHRGTFAQYVNGAGPFEQVLDRSSSTYRGDHFRPQTDYLHLNGEPIDFDVFGRFEHFASAVSRMAALTGLSADELTHEKRRPVGFPAHYSHFYTDREIAAVTERYRVDLEALGYRFDDRRTLQARLMLPAQRIRAGAVARASVAARRSAATVLRRR